MTCGRALESVKAQGAASGGLVLQLPLNPIAQRLSRPRTTVLIRLLWQDEEDGGKGLNLEIIPQMMLCADLEEVHLRKVATDTPSSRDGLAKRASIEMKDYKYGVLLSNGHADTGRRRLFSLT